MTKKKRSLRNEKLRVNRSSETEEQGKERLRIEDKTRNEKIENHEKERLSISKDWLWRQKKKEEQDWKLF